MILIDTNLLVYAHVAAFPQHVAARNWLDSRLSGSSKVGLAWSSILGFVRLVSNPRVFERPETIAHAWRQAEAWLDSSVAWVPLPTDRHREVLANILTTPDLRANHVPDAHLAALAIEHGLTLCSTDSDFARFPALRWKNPLA
ncbi:MAG: VapC toxin family PIN domain ribonuclease [Verrucomicrobia bacterium]|nr:VapC toxin family PIN domain ribonuclease [Verrucomicrobiota bacterium]